MSAADYPGPDGETLHRQRLPGAAERWESLPWENRMALLGGLAEEAAQHRREADFAASTAMQERYAALAETYETAHAVLMRADTVSSKDKSPDEVAAERAKYGAPRTFTRSEVLGAVRKAWDAMGHGNPVIALETVLAALGMGEYVATVNNRATLVD